MSSAILNHAHLNYSDDDDVDDNSDDWADGCVDRSRREHIHH